MARAARSGARTDIAALAVCTLLAVFFSVLPPGIRAGLAGSIQRSVAAPLLLLQRSAERARSAFVEREHMAASVDTLALRVNALKSLELENVRLRELLLLGGRLRTDFVPAEALHGQSPAESDQLLVTAGSNHGVGARSAVVAPEGIVGLVTSALPNTSIAIMYTHPDFGASAMSVDGGTFGIVSSHGGSEPERFLLELRGVPFRDALKPGTLIVTSGLGGVFPRGIPIGTVLGEMKTTEQWSRTYLVRPAVKPQDVSAVMVLAPSWSRAQAGQVWSTAAADAAVQRIVQSADSITRREAEERVARQRALDSATALLDAPPLTPPPASDTTRGAPNTVRAPNVAPRRDTARPPVRRPPQ